MNGKRITWHILGPGAIGCLWATYLRQAGYPVTLINRAPCSANSLTLINPTGRHSIDVSYTTAQQLQGSIDHLIVSTKAQQTTAAVQAIKPYLSTQANVLVIQNGMACYPLAEQLSTQSIFAAVTTDGAYRPHPQTVIHAGVGQTLVGAVRATNPTSKCQALIEQLPASGLHISHCDDIRQQLWKKLAINCAINALTAIYQCRNGQLLANQTAHRQLKMLCEETFLIIEQLGIPIAANAEALYRQVVDTCQVTKDNYSSMYQDIKQQHSTEIDFINGYLCQQADKAKLNCLHNRRITEQIKQLEQTTRSIP